MKFFREIDFTEKKNTKMMLYFLMIFCFNFSGRRRLLTRIKAKDHDGYFKTDVSFPRNPMMGRRSPTTNCLYGYWIVYIRDARSDLGIYIF